MPSIIARALEQRQKELSLGPDGIDYTVITRMLEQTFSEPAMTDRTVANLLKGYDPNRYAYLQQVFASAPVQRLQKSNQGLQAPDKAEEIKRLFEIGNFTDLFAICATREEGIDKAK